VKKAGGIAGRRTGGFSNSLELHPYSIAALQSSSLDNNAK